MNEITKVETGPLTIHTAPDISDLMRLAIEKGSEGVEILEKLVALRERVEDRNARHTFHDALAMFQADCPAIPKKSEVSFASRSSGTSVKYSYAALDTIVAIVRPLLTNRGLSFSWDSDVTEGKLTVTCILRHIDGCSQQAKFTCAQTSSNPIMSDQQKSGAALTYARRQSLVQVLGLVTTDEDTDAANENALDPITQDNVLDLEKLLADTGADRGKFLAVFGVERLEDIPKVQLTIATGLLQQKRRKP